MKSIALFLVAIFVSVSLLAASSDGCDSLERWYQSLDPKIQERFRQEEVALNAMGYENDLGEVVDEFGRTKADRDALKITYINGLVNDVFEGADCESDNEGAFDCQVKRRKIVCVDGDCSDESDDEEKVPAEEAVIEEEIARQKRLVLFLERKEFLCREKARGFFRIKRIEDFQSMVKRANELEKCHAAALEKLHALEQDATGRH